MNRKDFIKLASSMLLGAMLPKGLKKMPIQNYSGDYFIKMLNDLYQKTGQTPPAADMSTLQRLVDEERTRLDTYKTFLGVDRKIPMAALDLPIVPLYSRVLEADAASIDVQVSGDFKHLLIIGSGRTTEAAYFSNMRATFSGDSGTNYRIQGLFGQNTSTRATQGTGHTSCVLGTFTGASAPAGQAGGFYRFILNLSSGFWKTSLGVFGASEADATPDVLVGAFFGAWASTSPIQTVSIFPNSGNILANSSVSVYGLK